MCTVQRQTSECIGVLSHAAAVAVLGVPRTVGVLTRLFSAEDGPPAVSVAVIDGPCRR